MDTDLDHVGGCMANHSKFIKLLLSFVIAISPIILINNANAASLGGWTLGGGIAQGASTVYNGTKNLILNGKNVVQKGVATVTPTATGVAKVLGRGVAGYALSVAVEQLLGAVDWVLDPENNRIKYFPTETTFTCSVGSTSASGVTFAIAAESACRKFSQSVTYLGWEAGTGNNFTCKYRNAGGNVSYPSVCYPVHVVDRDKPQYIPLPTVAQKVISNAQGGDAAAQEATKAAAADMVEEAEKDSTKARPIVNQLESSAQTATDETATGESTKPDTSDPTAPPDVTNISLKFPVFCGWAPTVCQAASVVISFPTLVTEWWETANTKADGWATSISESWTAAKEWATSEPPKENTQLDIQNDNTQQIDTSVSFNSQCPSNFTLVDFSYHGISQSWIVDFSKFCNVFGTYVKPVVIAMGAFSAALIIGGVRTNE